MLTLIIGNTVVVVVIVLLTIQIVVLQEFFEEIISAAEFCFSPTNTGMCLFRSFRKLLVMNDDTKLKEYFMRVIFKLSGLNFMPLIPGRDEQSY